MKCVKQFWNFGKIGDTFLDLNATNELVALLGKVVRTVREDKTARLEQFKTAKKQMDEEDIDYFKEDLKKVDRIEHHVMEIAGVVIHVYKDSISPAFI